MMCGDAAARSQSANRDILALQEDILQFEGGTSHADHPHELELAAMQDTTFV